jgi:exodeoxyribonuclease V gamma subunit
MPLAIRYVRSLEDVIEPALKFLDRRVDVFARQQIVVPTAGAKAWLAATIARTLGARGASSGDGILANVEFSYPGTISSLLAPEAKPPVDPWDVEHLTFAILRVIVAVPTYAAVIKRAGGPLLAARRIADRFDHYHFRRPSMILEWEEGHGVLCPETDEQGSVSAAALPKLDRWQFDLWRAVRERIGSPSPPAREQAAKGPGPEAVLVAGLQGLSLHQIELLQKLAELPSVSGSPCDVRAVLVHPSPALREQWAAEAPPVSTRVAPVRREPLHREGVDPLVEAWLRGTREAQWLLAAQGIAAKHDDGVAAVTPPPADASLLGRLQHNVATGCVAEPPATFSPTDTSVLIHRCHDLSRQAEVLHDAILHAFRDMPDLAPHDVVVVSPRIADLAPHLEAAFGRTVSDGTDTVTLPLMVADRGIREVSAGAELLAALIEVVGSRSSVDAILAVAEHPLVLDEFGVDDNGRDAWERCIDRTKVRWGLDAARRSRAGLDMPTLDAHTWKQGIARMLLGATVPDGDPVAVLGDIVPLDGVELADIDPLSKLISIIGVIDELDLAIESNRTVPDWCDLLETALERLAGAESDELAVPLQALDELRRSAKETLDAEDDIAVPWHDIKTILAGTLTAPVGRQPLRTGAITATSMIPLRGVPFRVVCVAGLDDGAVSPPESDSEDLVDRQQLMGDLDPRLEVRRGLLDCMLAAGDRLVITCTGMDVKTNATVPLVTPLAEFVDFACRHGVPMSERNGEAHAAIEIFHPRHACSSRNFLGGHQAVVPGLPAWSHDAAAKAAAEALGKDLEASSASADQSLAPTSIDLKDLAEFMHDPLYPFVRKTLGINPWRDDDLTIAATLPLELESFEKRNLRNDYIEKLLARDTSSHAALKASWSDAAKANGDVPLGPHGELALAEITDFAASLLDVASDEGVPLDQRQPAELLLALDGVTVSGTIERWYEPEGTVVLVRPDAKASGDPPFLKAKMLAVVDLLALVASGRPAQRALVFNQHPDWQPGQPPSRTKPAQVRAITLADDIDASRAKAHLHSLAKLYAQAAVKPFAAFRHTASKLVAEGGAAGEEAAREEFALFTAGARYADSLEAVVHGFQPDFDDRFQDDDVLDFFRLHASQTGVVWDRKAKAYVYTPQ